MAEITKDSVIDNGTVLSNNFILGHLTSGAYHPQLGEWLPKFSAKLIPSQYNNLLTPNGVPIWMIAKNLQLSSQKILENLFKEFGGDLILRSGYLGNAPQSLLQKGMNEIQHTVGASFDIQVKGFEDNLYSIAKDVQSIARQASNLQMVFGNTSWMHIGFDPKKLAANATRVELPIFSSTDLLTGVTEKGIQSLRGVI